MKQPTINQINGRIKQNPTIQYFLQLDRERDSYAVPYSDRNYRSREYDFCTYRPDGTKDTRRVSITGNFLFIAACKEFASICGLANRYESRATKYGNYELSFNDKIYASFNVRLVASVYYGVCIEVESYHSNALKFQRHQVRSNQTFEALDHIAYFEKYILPKHYFAPGLFRNIQMVYNLTKSQVADKYRQLAAQWKLNASQDTDDLKYAAITRRLRRKKNLLVKWFINPGKLMNVLISSGYPRQPKPIELCEMPNVWDLHDQLSREFDDDDDIMNEAENIIMDNRIIYC